MHRDRYGLPLTTRSARAAEAYTRGVDLFLAGQAAPLDAFDAAVAADEGFALAHLARARVLQVEARPDDMRAAFETAELRGAGASEGERAAIAATRLLLQGRGPQALESMRACLAEAPRDAMLAQACLGVFGLIGFSGQPGREAACLALAESLAPAYGGDWWFMAQHAFAEIEIGQTGPAAHRLERSLRANPENAFAAHYTAHLHYERGETAAGRLFLTEWMQDYDRAGILHCHNSWHIAIWALAEDDLASVWAVVESDLLPEVSASPRINILTDLASLYFRIRLAGHEVPAERWAALSAWAEDSFPRTGVAFIDCHAALAHAMAGAAAPLARIESEAAGPAADLVASLAAGFRALAAGAHDAALERLVPAMADHARLGGSRAQRDLLELAAMHALVESGRRDEARRLRVMRRPVADLDHAVAGL